MNITAVDERGNKYTITVQQQLLEIMTSGRDTSATTAFDQFGRPVRQIDGNTFELVGSNTRLKRV